MMCPLCGREAKRMVHTPKGCYTRLAGSSRLYVWRVK